MQLPPAAAKLRRLGCAHDLPVMPPTGVLGQCSRSSSDAPGLAGVTVMPVKDVTIRKRSESPQRYLRSRVPTLVRSLLLTARCLRPHCQRILPCDPPDLTIYPH